MDPVVELKRLTWYRMLRHVRKARDKRSASRCLPDFHLRGAQAGTRIRELIEGPEPCMIARFGNNELRTLENFLAIRSSTRLSTKVSRYLRGESGPWWWDDRTAREMQLGAGFFPATPENLERFSLLTLRDVPEIDVLGSWLPAESLLGKDLRAARVPLEDLEPYFHADPWSEGLRGRRVLVVHPFAESIRQQFERRLQLFRDTRVLPEFDLQTFRSVQSIGGTCPGYRDWFAALAAMQQGIAALDFEVAIIGAGAYGMPLAAFIKRDLGRKAVHLGGATQILFGIRGKRWDAFPGYAEGLYNESWCRPRESETPTSAPKIEGGCYW